MPSPRRRSTDPDRGLQQLQRRRWASLGRLLGFASGIFNDRVIGEIQRRGHPEVGLPHSRLTRSIDLEGTRITVLARRAGVTKQAMGKLVQEMSELGYVRTIPDPTDGRAKLVTYTRRGLVLARHIVEAAEVVEGQYEAVLGRRRLRELRALLAELVPRIVPAQLADEQGWRSSGEAGARGKEKGIKAR